MLSVLSLLVAASLLWLVRNRTDFILFMVPAWFLVLFVMVRVVPYLVPPRLEARDFSGVTTLDLNQPEADHVDDYEPKPPKSPTQSS